MKQVKDETSLNLDTALLNSSPEGL
jgi:hypothetical protein